MTRRRLAGVSAGALVAAAAASAAVAPRDLPVSYLFSGPGHLTTLKAGVYQASNFPIAVRWTVRDATWAGAQWKTGRLGCCGTINGIANDGGPPFFGWLSVGKGGTNPRIAPKGLVVVETAFSGTPSPAAVVSRLRTQGTGATFGEMSPVKLAGYVGFQIDARVVGPKHNFIPFGMPTHTAHFFPDAITVEQPQVFHIEAINVRGKTVVVFIANGGLDAGKFPAFVTQADQCLSTLRFPA